MKIALSGVSGSGKTTLLPIIAEKLGYRKIQSASSIIEEKYNIKLKDEEFNEDIQTEILNTQIMNELPLHNDLNFISDRSILDILTYTISYYSYINFTWFIEYYKKLIKSYKYDMIFKLPSNVLETDSSYVRNLVIDNLLYSIIKHESESKHFKFIEIPTHIVNIGIERTSKFITDCILSYEIRQSIERKGLNHYDKR